MPDRQVINRIWVNYSQGKLTEFAVDCAFKKAKDPDNL